MILQSLYDYYKRMPSESGIAPPGFERKEIPFIIVLNEEGEFISLEDTREGTGKKKKTKSFLVPQSVKRTSGINANLLWDKITYVFGIDTKGKPERAHEQQKAFIQEIREKADVADKGVKAVLKYLESGDYKALSTHPLWQEMLETSPNVSFRLVYSDNLICQTSPAVTGNPSESNCIGRFCLVTGNLNEVARLHPPIKGVWGAKTSGANIVSFNQASFKSFGKEQGENAPVGEKAAFAYTTALNHLLRKDSLQRVQVGDASTVFWAEKENPLEDIVAKLFGETRKDDPDRNTRAVRSLYASPNTGAAHFDDDGTRFFVLGLSPNASRISIRFWQVTTVGKLAQNFRQHFEDISIEHAPYEPEYLSLLPLLECTARQGDSKNIFPNLAGNTMKSILSGLLYPQTLLQEVVRRIRSEQSKKEKEKSIQNVNYPRAALIKACLNRKTRRFNPTNEKEITVSLDETNLNIGYRLGRLFAVLEKVQQEANPGINATIRDRFYGAASSTPASVFPRLLKLKNHHIAKLENHGLAVNREKLIGQIMDGFSDFPSWLIIEDQGRFAIGYYHQRQKIFKKTETEPKENKNGYSESLRICAVI